MNQEIQHYQDVTSVGKTANAYAAYSAFSDYQGRIAANTLRRQEDDLILFSSYLSRAGLDLPPLNLLKVPATWKGITYGLVEGFVRWMLQEGYAIGSINVRLSTVKRYCALAAKAGILSSEDMNLIKLVQGFKHQEGRNIDTARKHTRIGSKKAQSILLTKEQIEKLKSQPNTPQGRRDALLMCLFLDIGLRCGEVASLTTASINITEGTLTFYREKVDIMQKHELTRDTLIAAIRYLEVCRPQGKLLMGSRKSKNGDKLEGTMSTRAITERVRVLGEAIGVHNLSAHDGRHAWVDSALRGGTDLVTLQGAGGWSSIAMPARYASAQKIANKGVKLG